MCMGACVQHVVRTFIYKRDIKPSPDQRMGRVQPRIYVHGQEDLTHKQLVFFNDFIF